MCVCVCVSVHPLLYLSSSLPSFITLSLSSISLLSLITLCRYLSPFSHLSLFSYHPLYLKILCKFTQSHNYWLQLLFLTAFFISPSICLFEDSLPLISFPSLSLVTLSLSGSFCVSHSLCLSILTAVEYSYNFLLSSDLSSLPFSLFLWALSLFFVRVGELFFFSVSLSLSTDLRRRRLNFLGRKFKL